MLWIWLGFSLLVIGMLILDLGVFNKTDHVVTLKESLAWTSVWIALALSFSIFIYFAYENHWAGLGARFDNVVGSTTNGKDALLKYLTGYVLEKSLSIDNIFVISMIFTSFAIPPLYQHRVLFWGVIGAILMRAVMILVGAELIARHHWVVYVFGILLLLTAAKMLLIKTHNPKMTDNLLVRLARKILPVTNQFHGTHFIIREQSPAQNGAISKTTLVLTPLALALIAVEATDLLFAVDSVPAIFAVTADPFLVFTSNIFAMLGLRSLYFALAGLIDRFRYLKTSLALVLLVVGVKMLTASWIKSTFGSGAELWLLALILLILAAGVFASWIADRRRPKTA